MTPPQPVAASPTTAGLLLRVGLVLIATLFLFQLLSPLLYEFFGYLLAATLGVFFAGLLPNALVVRIFERGQLTDVGLGWQPGARRQFAAGIGLAACAVIVVALLPVAAGWAHWKPAPGGGWSTLLFAGVALLFGSVGEELMFRGYAFQVAHAILGPWIAVPLFSAVFALAHMGNLSVNWLAALNTALWGAVLAIAFLRTGRLWLSIGLHYGWNLCLCLSGANMSGFTIRLGAYEMEWSGHALLSGGAYGPEAGLLTTVAAVSLGLLLFRLPFTREPVFLLHYRHRE